MMMEGSLTAVAPLLLRNLITSIFIFVDKSLQFVPNKYKLLQLACHFLLSSFLFFLRLLPLLFTSLNPSKESYNCSSNPSKVDYCSVAGGGGSSGIERALYQLLAIMNDIPVCSRKYELIRSLAEKIVDENLAEGNKALRKINCRVLLASFLRTLGQFESTLHDLNRFCGDYDGDVCERKKKQGEEYHGLDGVFKVLRYCGDVVCRSGRSRIELSRSGMSTQKMGAELLWLARKLAACGCVENAISLWASASNLAMLGLSAEPNIQAYLIKLSAFFFKQAAEMGTEIDYEGEQSTREKNSQVKIKMLISWLPFLCRASNGADEPVLNSNERAEIERNLEDIIEKLEEAEDQEKVLSLWLHHFTYCASSDWPNLHACYSRWCHTSRKLFLQD